MERVSLLKISSEQAQAQRCGSFAGMIGLFKMLGGWDVTSTASAMPLSKFTLENGAVPGLLARFAELQRKAQARTARHFPLIVIQEEGFVLPLRLSASRLCHAQQLHDHTVQP